MAKENGLGMSVAVDDSNGTARTISNDLTTVGISTPRAIQNVTGIDKSAMERIQGLGDAQVSLNGVFNDAANMSHDVFKTVPSTSVNRTVTTGVSGQTLPLELRFNDYNLSRGANGELTFSSSGQLADGTVPTWA